MTTMLMLRKMQAVMLVSMMKWAACFWSTSVRWRFSDFADETYDYSLFWFYSKRENEQRGSPVARNDAQLTTDCR